MDPHQLIKSASTCVSCSPYASGAVSSALPFFLISWLVFTQAHQEYCMSYIVHTLKHASVWSLADFYCCCSEMSDFTNTSLTTLGSASPFVHLSSLVKLWEPISVFLEDCPDICSALYVFKEITLDTMVMSACCILGPKHVLLSEFWQWQQNEEVDSGH